MVKTITTKETSGKPKFFDPLLKELKACLTGNAVSAFLLCIAPEQKHLQCSRETIQFAQSLNLIEVKAQKAAVSSLQISPTDAKEYIETLLEMRKQLEIAIKENETLKEALAGLRSCTSAPLELSGDLSQTIDQEDSEIKPEVDALRLQMQQTEQELEQVRDELRYYITC